MMAKKLKKLLINRVDLVPAGANPDAHIVLYKSAEPAPVTKDEHEDDDHMPLTTEQILQRNQLWSQWHPLWDAFTSSVWEVMSCCEDTSHHAPVLMQSIDQFATKAKELLSGLGLVDKAALLFDLFTEVEKAGRVMSGRRMQRLKEAMSTLQTILDEAMTSSMPKKSTAAAKGADMPTLEDVTKRADAAEARVKELEAENVTLKADLAKAKQTPEEQEAEYLKGLPEAVRKKYEADQLEKADLRKKLKEADDRSTRQEYIAKTASYRQVGITPDHWNVLKAIDGLPEQERKELLRILDSTNEVIKQGAVFRVMGADGSPSGDGAYAKIEIIAKGLVEKGDAKTMAQAIDLVSQRQPDLYGQYQAERRG